MAFKIDIELKKPIDQRELNKDMKQTDVNLRFIDGGISWRGKKEKDTEVVLKRRKLSITTKNKKLKGPLKKWVESKGDDYGEVKIQEVPDEPGIWDDVERLYAKTLGKLFRVEIDK